MLKEKSQAGESLLKEDLLTQWAYILKEFFLWFNNEHLKTKQK